MREASYWIKSDRADPSVVPLADKHYNRQAIGSPQFVPPGRCVVLKTEKVDAFWVSSFPFAEFVRHAWAGAIMCSAFRNESKTLSSTLIAEAVAITGHFFSPPDLGMITFIDPVHVRHKRDLGRCYRKAGFTLAKCPDTSHVLLSERWPDGTRKTLKIGGGQEQGPFLIACAACNSRTKRGLLALQLLPEDWPEPVIPIEIQGNLFEVEAA